MSAPAEAQSPTSAESAATAATAAAPASPTAIARVHAVVAEDFAALNHLIPRQLTSDVAMVEEIGSYIVEAGGKRLRPLLTLLAAGACGDRSDHRIRLAAVIEFLHTATLLHDDVVDKSALRRGRATANSLWGNAPSVLVGDFLYSRAFQMMTTIGNMQVLTILSDATNVIAEGEVLQLSEVGNTEITEARYMQVIQHKTAMLFQAASHTAAVLAGCNQTTEHALRDYGLHLGQAYQLVDDLLDYTGSAEVMGKNVGDDLAEGKLTLPLIHTIAHGSAADAATVRAAVAERSLDHLPEVIKAVRSSGALAYTRDAALRERDAALACAGLLAPSKYRDALKTLAEFATERAA